MFPSCRLLTKVRPGTLVITCACTTQDRCHFESTRLRCKYLLEATDTPSARRRRRGAGRSVEAWWEHFHVCSIHSVIQQFTQHTSSSSCPPCHAHARARTRTHTHMQMPQNATQTCTNKFYLIFLPLMELLPLISASFPRWVARVGSSFSSLLGLFWLSSVIH